jgi:hypothetical protein
MTTHSLRRRTGAKLAALFAALALAACSASVKPNPTYPGFTGTYGPGASGWLGTGH